MRTRLKNLVRGIPTAMAVVLLCLCLMAPRAFYVWGRAPKERVGASSSSSERVQRPSFRIRGVARGLYPGRRKPLGLSVRNNNDFAIGLRKVTVTAEDSNKPECSAHWLKLARRVSVQMRVKAGRRVRLPYPMRLRPGTPTECQRAKWPLEFGGRAVKR